MTLPLIYLTGSAYEKGRQHGEALRDRILNNVEAYFGYFGRLGVNKAGALDRARALADAVRHQNPDYHEAMRGIADGSGVPFDEIAALNMRSEIVYYLRSKQIVELSADGCTAWAVHPGRSDDGHLRIGQNWDWNRDVLGAILHETVSDDFAVLGFTEAGQVGCKIGLNSAGVGLCINGLFSNSDSWEAVVKPMHVRFYEILRQENLDAAVDIIVNEDRSIAGNFLLGATPNHAANIEAGTSKHNRIDWRDGFIVHANHFVDPEGSGIDEPVFERRETSVGRHERMEELLGSAETVSHDDLVAFSRDRANAPESICRLGDDPLRPAADQGVSVTAAILDLTAGEAWFTDGPPSGAEYVRYSL